mgnify:CR=1 FL=1
MLLAELKKAIHDSAHDGDVVRSEHQRLTQAHPSFLRTAMFRLETSQVGRDAGVFGVEVARAAGDLLRRELTGPRRIEFKGSPTNLVTEMDAIVLSYEIGSMKPSPDIYLAGLEALDATADEAVFVDDNAEFVAGAEAVGIPSLRIDREADRLAATKA